MSDVSNVASLTPMMRQYFEIKQQYPDTLVFYRLGDFYELFHDDAKVISDLLDLTLTRRNNVPMAGVPFHAADGYIARLIKLGRSVVICEQVGDRTTTKGMMERKVSRIITPGTVTDEGMVPEREENIIACIFEQKGVFGLSHLNISSGKFVASEYQSLADLSVMLSKLSPAELLYPERFTYYKDIQNILCRKALPLWDFDYDNAVTALCKQFNTMSLNGFGVDKLHTGICAAAALINYVKSTQNTDLEHVRAISLEESNSLVIIDRAARKNLELTESLSGELRGSLLGVLDKTSTAMGSRLLRNMLLNPLRNNTEIEGRLDLVEALAHANKRFDLSELLSSIGDLERIVARIGLRSAKPRDLSTLRDSLSLLPELKELLRTCVQQTSDAGAQSSEYENTDNSNATAPAPAPSSACADTVSASDDVTTSEEVAPDTCSAKDTQQSDAKSNKYRDILINKAEMLPKLDEVYELLKKAIAEMPALLVRDGGVIASEYSPELDELRELQSGSERILMKIEEREKERTEISSLKVRFNNVHGFYIEVSKSNSDKVPADYIRRQTLKNSERYITPELKELEDKTLSAKTRALLLEKELYDQIVEELIKHLPDLSAFAHNVAVIDTALSLAKCALEHHYVRPELSSDNIIKIEEGRHAVVEAISDTPFIANSLELSPERNLAVISGPNMGGKSTFMRQVALIAIMARIGSFVPAKSAIIGDIDRIFTRIGASDDLSSGRSTFMVEMEETATILNNATDLSLVIMDEVGRGTSGAEGSAIAEAIVQYLAKDIHPKTMFATHYAEVTTLVELYPNAFNLCFNAKEFNGKIVFLYQAEKGRQSRSFGIEVAQLAGVPVKITKKAIGFYIARTKELDNANIFTPPLLATNDLGNLDNASDNNASTENAPASQIADAKQKQATLEAKLIEAQAQAAALQDELSKAQSLMQSIKEIDLNSLTPLQALNTLSSLKETLTAKN